jgi:hypothetical protein
MPCNRYRMPGGVAIVCSRGQRRSTCQTTGCTGTTVALCDFPLSGRKKGATCSRRMCARCRVSQPGEDVDYCRTHAAQGRLAMSGGT